MPGQHQVEQPRRQHAAHAQTEPRTEPGFFLRMGWGAVSVVLDLGTFSPAPRSSSRATSDVKATWSMPPIGISNPSRLAGAGFGQVAFQ